MKTSFKLSIAFLTLFFCISIVAQRNINNSLIEQTPNLQKVEANPNQEDIWDLLLSFDVTTLSGAFGNAGAEWDGNYFYSTRWASNLIHKYNSTGTALIEEFSIPGVSGLRDLAFDGQYMYGGAASNAIYQMDFNTKTLIATIPSPVAVRFIAYDEIADAFWVGNWSDNPTLVSRSGTTLASLSTGLMGQYGAAYDNMSPGGGTAYLWIFDQGAGAGTPQLIHQFDISTGTATGVVHDVALDFPNAIGIAGGLFMMTDWPTSALALGGLLQGTPDNMFVYRMWPCMLPPPYNENPPYLSQNVSINLSQLSWTNGVAVTTELYFGTDPNNLTLVQSGALDSVWNIDPGYLPLEYNTTYYWQVRELNPGCNVNGPRWNFKTELNPFLLTDTITVYIKNELYSTGSTDSINKYDGEINTVYPNVGWAVFDISGFPLSTSAITSIQFFGYVNATNFPYWSATPMGTVNPITADAAAIYNQINSNYGQGTAYIYRNETSSFTLGWYDFPLEASATTDFLNSLANGWFAMGFIDRDLNPNYYINFDGHTQFNPPFLRVIYEYTVPVELASLTAETNDKEVSLCWITATETNNQGFEIQREDGSRQSVVDCWERIGFVEGNGTTTERKYYSFTDRPDPGKYKYRLKQIDFDGLFEYSSEVEAEILSPLVFSLEQNYPNPFNPSTKIKYTVPDVIASGAKQSQEVTIKIYDVLGREVTILVNEEKEAGRYEVEFNAASLPSGIYFYRMEAGTFVDVKKMIVIK